MNDIQVVQLLITKLHLLPSYMREVNCWFTICHPFQNVTTFLLHGVDENDVQISKSVLNFGLVNDGDSPLCST